MASKEQEYRDDTVLVRLTHDRLDPTELMDFVRTPRAGAIVYFGGTTRDNMSGKKVADLSYDAYVPLAVRTLTKIAQKTISEWSPDKSTEAYVCKVAVVHRLGPVGLGEESVVIAVSAGHRKEGWQAAEGILESVKACAEIWKNERYEDGTALWQANDGTKPAKFDA